MRRLGRQAPVVRVSIPGLTSGPVLLPVTLSLTLSGGEHGSSEEKPELWGSIAQRFTDGLRSEWLVGLGSSREALATTTRTCVCSVGPGGTEAHSGAHSGVLESHLGEIIGAHG
jgi:hypothetical protein